MAALISASPYSTGPAEAAAVKISATAIAATRPNVVLIRNRTPAPSRKIEINHGASGGAERQQRKPRRGFMQEQFPGTEQHAVNQRASRGPIDQILPAVA